MTRPRLRPSVAAVVELLEPRMLLSVSTQPVSGTPVLVSNDSDFPAAWEGYNPRDDPIDFIEVPGLDVWSPTMYPAQGKVDSGLVFVLDRIQKLRASDPLADLGRATSEYLARVTADGMVEIDAHVDDITPAVLEGLAAAGLRVEDGSKVRPGADHQWYFRACSSVVTEDVPLPVAIVVPGDPVPPDGWAGLRSPGG